MGWFTDLTGFAEGSYDGTKQRLCVSDGRLHSLVNNKSYGIGIFEMAALETLRAQRVPHSGKLKLSIKQADVQALHRAPENAGALFQVASQFNMLEMTGSSVTPEDGVTRYAWDHTQGPACAIAAGAATIYRNYFVPVGTQIGQTADRQLDGLAEMGQALSALTRLPVHALWNMENGYALALPDGLRAIDKALLTLSPAETDALRGQLRVGLQRDVEVTDNPAIAGQLVSQVFCSAMPLGYSGVPDGLWEPLARLVLEATYEATLLCAEANALRSGSRRTFLTLVGAGAFGNPRSWVLAALRRALILFRNVDLDVVVVSHGEPPKDLPALSAEFAFGQ